MNAYAFFARKKSRVKNVQMYLHHPRYHPSNHSKKSYFQREFFLTQIKIQTKRNKKVKVKLINK